MEHKAKTLFHVGVKLGLFDRRGIYWGYQGSEEIGEMKKQRTGEK
jgi:hypothetical protein